VPPSAARLALCCIADQATYTVVARACTAAGLTPMPAGFRELATPPAASTPEILIYDLHTMPGANPRDLVRSWRARYPRSPVLLYCSGEAEHVGLAAELGLWRGIVVWPRQPGGQDPIQGLARLLHYLTAPQPSQLVYALLESLRPNASPKIQAFAAALLDHLAQGGEGAPSISGLAAKAACEPWQLRRACAAARLPSPEHLVEWLTLIYVLALADREGLSVTEASRRAGLDRKYIPGLRSRLMPEVSTFRGRTARDLLAEAVGGFAHTLGLRSGRRAALLSHVLRA